MSAARRFFAAAAAIAAAYACPTARCGAAEIEVGEAVKLPTGGYSSDPAVAWGGGPAGGEDGSYLVVWQEGWHGLGGKADICAARVAAGGKVLDAKPIAVAQREGAQAAPAVAYAAGAKTFLVVWADLGSGTDYDVYAVRLDGAGKLLDRKPVPVAAASGVNEVQPGVASDGTNFLVAWASFKMQKDRRGADVPAYDVLAARVAADTGAVLDKQPVRVAESGHSVAVASGGKDYLVVWSGPKRSTDGVRIAPDGKMLDASPIVGITGQGAGCPELPSAAALKDGYVAVGSRAPQPDWWGWGGPGAFMIGRVTPDGKAPEAQHKLNGWKWGLLCDDALPNIVDSARWAKSKGEQPVKGWPKGAPGGFRYAYRNEWPYAYSAVAPDGKGGCVAAWTLGHLTGTVNVHNLDVRLRHFAPGDAWPKGPKVAAAATPADETFPALAKGPESELLLAYELVEPGQAPCIAVRVVTVK